MLTKEVLSIAKRRARYGLLVLGLLFMLSAALPTATSPARAASSVSSAVSTPSIGNNQLYRIYVAANSKYVTAAGILLSATATTYNSSWTHYQTVLMTGTPNYALRCVASGKYVTVDSASQLRASASSIGHWERFVITRVPGGYSTTYTIQSVANGKYVSVGASGILGTVGHYVGPWEKFEFLDFHT